MNPPGASRGEIGTADLEQAHHDLCTAMTIVRSRGDLLRRELHGTAGPGRHLATETHLVEIDKAVDRLHDVALTLRAWRAVMLSSVRP